MTDTTRPVTDTTRAREAIEALFDEERLSAESASRLLALCDEVESLRARLAGAPEVLGEWPKTAEEAPGEWFFCTHGDLAPRGKFEQREGYAMLVFLEECLGRVWVFGEFKAGEFFVRCP